MINIKYFSLCFNFTSNNNLREKKTWVLFSFFDKYFYDTKRDRDLVNPRQLFLIHFRFIAGKGYSERRPGSRFGSYSLALSLPLCHSLSASALLFFFCS